ncbi:unnamed protein product [Effrenium voratum]|uniref:Carrier domain-containing protein n=1 Tax=Effrenium voratum TaxID=2562239 RepID=A0AA36IF30_9DINO|nr:unnamed protein product [Effrenium voratum]
MFAADANALELLHQQLVEVDGQLCMPGHETNLGELLLTAAEKKGEGVCLEVDTACYTFAQMARMATAIRRVLRKALQSLELPTEPGSPEAHRRRADEHVVTIVLDRGVKSIAAVHAVMLERCAYSAFDVAEPIQKLRTWVEVARPPVMISSSGVLKRLGLTDIAASLGEFPRVVLDVDLALRKAEEATVPTKARHSPDDLDRLAYLIFTSGSTGKPKAVMIRHKSALNVARIWGNYVGLSSQDRFAQVASMSWDVHIIEVYGTMAAMATSVTCPDLVKKSGPDMVSWLKERQISGMSVVPSHLRTMSAAGEVSTRALPHLKILDVGGEALGADVVDAWAPGRRLVNSYGPSEISVVCTGAYVTPGEPITIGGPLPTYSCYILDPETLEEKAQGEQGVLFVGGVGLARGYLEEEEKTRSKFLEHPRLGRVYDTGDLASVDKLGRINYHGRVDWQVKVRGVRIELEALEQAIAELAGVQHCEARVSEDNQRLVLLVSGSSSEAELKQKALSLGRGYMLSQVKMVDSGDWKFNASGKLLRNAVPLEEVVREVKQDGWEAFDKSECSELELEIAQCLAPQVTEAWSRKDHFMEDLGVDSGGFGRLITQMRARPRLHKVDLQMLFEYPTVQALAQHLSEESADSDDEVTADAAGETFVDVFLASVAMNPHSLCRESQCEALSYLQMRRLACAYQRLLRRAKPRRPAPVAILLQGYQQMAAMIAACMEGFAFCLLDNTEDSAEQLQQLEPCAIMAEAQTLAELAWKAQTSAALVDVSGASALLTQPPLANLGAKAEDAACVALAPGTQPLVLSHLQLAALVEVWRPHLMPSKRVRLSAGLGTCARTVAAVATMSCGATLVEDRPQLVISEVSGRTPKAQTLVVAGQTWFTAVPEAPARLNSATWSQNSRLSGLLASASRLSLATELGPYMLGRGKNKSYGPHSWPKLCAMVQGLAILAQPVMIAARLLLAERILLPMIFVAPMWLIAIVLLALLTFEQFLRVFILVATKWILIGRYREGDHDIYSLYYLRHWLVEHVAKGTLVGQAAHQGSSISFLFLRNLALKALGAKIHSTAVITARCVAYDLISVDALATVHGPRHLTAVNYGERRMALRPVKVGAGAYVGPNCTLEPGCEVAPAGYVEPLSTVSSRMVVQSRVSGVPAKAVGPLDQSRLVKPEEVRSFRRWAAALATGYWVLLIPKAAMPVLAAVGFQLITSFYKNEPQVRSEMVADDHVDALPLMYLDQLKWIPVLAFAVSTLQTVMQLLVTAAFCRLLPKVQPPFQRSLVSIRAQIAALKMSMVLQASEMLADASIVPWFIRMCGASFGHGCAMGLQVTLPETLEVGHGCFFATGNILTSVDVDQGQFKVPCKTVMSDHTFLGNHNHLPQGLPEGSFCGVGTWLPNRPTEPNMSYFGNPAMKFRRLGNQSAGTRQGPERASCLARMWHHFSTSVMDVFLYRGVQGMVTGLALLSSRRFCPVITQVWEPFALLLIYMAYALGSWYLFSVVLGNLLFNNSAPHSNAYYSTTVTRWFTALTAQQRVFKLPFQTAGSRWQAPILRLLGARVGKRFFCMNEMVLVDAPFTEVGDDVTVDYDGQVRCHSFEDFRLKFTTFKIGHGVTIMTGASVAMCDAGDGATLRPGSLTWKGSNLEPGGVYEGAPAALDLERGPPLLRKAPMEGK